MSTRHDSEQKDTGEREAAKTEEEAHMFKCWDKRGGPGWEIREWAGRTKVKIAFWIGICVAVQAIGVVAVRAVTESVVRKTVIEVLKEHRLITEIPAVKTMVVTDEFRIVPIANAQEGKAP